MRPIHQHEIDHITRADLADRLIATTALAFFLTLSWLLPAVGVWGILLPWAAGGPAPDPVLLGGLGLCGRARGVCVVGGG
ncbi:MAG TPA: hypothetical protein VGB42_08745 [Candidatus Thermoplasmatota archaeon]